jgi:hypothetical protein
MKEHLTKDFGEEKKNNDNLQETTNIVNGQEMAHATPLTWKEMPVL